MFRAYAFIVQTTSSLVACTEHGFVRSELRLSQVLLRNEGPEAVDVAVIVPVVDVSLAHRVSRRREGVCLLLRPEPGDVSSGQRGLVG